MRQQLSPGQLIVLTLLAAAGIVWGADRLGDPAPVYRWPSDPLPEVYTGEATDVDGDGEPEGFLYGSPAAPTVERFEGSTGAIAAAAIGALPALLLFFFATRKPA